MFSGALTQQMHDLLIANSKFEPLDILVSQLDRSSIKQTIAWKHEIIKRIEVDPTTGKEHEVVVGPFCRWLFIDSGAFSVHTGKAKCTTDEYIEFLNSIDDDIDVFAQLDTIPGHLGKPKTPEDYAESAKKSWDNFLYMRKHVRSPHKLMPVFHFGESMDVLRFMLEWKDENGQQLDYIGLSPANDVSVATKDIYLQECADIIAASSNPNVKTHLYGYTALSGLSKLPCYSADSISHRQIAGYAKILSRNFGVISVSKRPRSVASKSNLSFLETADEYNLSVLENELADLGFKLNDILDEVPEDYERIASPSAVRVAVNMLNIQHLIQTRYKYDPNRVKRPLRLFNLPQEV